MYKKIKIYSVVLAVIYGAVFMQGAWEFAQGFMMGINKGTSEMEAGVTGSIYHFMVRPHGGYASFPETTINQITGQEVKIEANEYIFSVVTSGSDKSALIIAVIKGLMSFVFVGLVVYVFILFFKTIRAVTKDKIIDESVIRKIRKIGWIIIFIFSYRMIFYIADYCIAKETLKIANYEIIMDYSGYTTLVLGIVTLLLGEILKVSLYLKEEQDLTI